VAVMSVDLHWIPLGAGGHVVAFNGRVFEALAAGRAHRPRRALYHAALVVETAGVRFAIELAPETDDAVATGPVGARWAGRLRLFRYGLRCTPGGTIPDLAYAVGGAVHVSGDPAVAARIVALAPQVPRLTWGRDEAGMHMHEDWPARFAEAGFAVESERRFVIALQPPPDSPMAASVARYAMATFCRARHGLEDKLSAGDIAELDALAPALSARDDLTVRTSRTVWLARKPAG